MLDFSDSKSMAKALRKALAERHIAITHSVSLELVARQFGFANWNMLAAKIEDAPELKLPEGWITAGGQPDLYRLGIDPEVPGAIKIESREPSLRREASATVMQSIDASDYMGKALHIRAELRSRSAGRGVLWMRIDPAHGGRYLRFDNMMYRRIDGALEGDVDWVERNIVLDIPDGADSIHYGVLLSGGGELWACNLVVEEVDPDAVTITEARYPRRPTNLDFGAAA
jgi:hypothetical protein